MLSKRLRECREKCGFSQQKVADCLNIDRSTYSYYESGRTEPSVENIKKLARLFRVSVAALLEIEEELQCARDGVQMRDDPHGTKDDAFGERASKEEKKRGLERVGELTRDERQLIMRYRMLTDKQRRDFMLSMMLSDEDSEEE